MKQTIPGNGGHRRYYNDDILHINQAIIEGTSAIVAMFGQNFFLVSPQIVIAGSTASNSAGWIVYKGEICQIDVNAGIVALAGQTNLAIVPVTTFRTPPDPLVYADASSQSPHIIKKVKLQWYDPGAPPADYVDANTFLDNIWNLVNTGTNPVLQDSFSIYGADGGGTRQPQYRKRPGGKCQLKGRMQFAEFDSGFSYIAFTLPVGYRPVTEWRGVCTVDMGVLHNPQYIAANVIISTGGTIEILFGDGVTAGIVYLDNIEFDII